MNGREKGGGSKRWELNIKEEWGKEVEREGGVKERRKVERGNEIVIYGKFSYTPQL